MIRCNKIKLDYDIIFILLKNNYMAYDVFSNMIVSINRGIVKKQFKIYCKKSKYLFKVLSIFLKEGLINGYRMDPLNEDNIEILLKYSYGFSIIKKVKQMSLKSRKRYIKKYELINKLLYENYYINGILIISTTKGIMSHKEAILKNLGGTIICKIL